jgi:hypothetical protein
MQAGKLIKKFAADCSFVKTTKALAQEWIFGVE